MTTEPRPLPPHTPGPWIAKCFLVRQANGQQLEICHTGIIGRNKPGEQAEADAALIARAPELLARVAELEQEKQFDANLSNKVLQDNARLRELLRQCLCADDVGWNMSPEMKDVIRKELQ